MLAKGRCETRPAEPPELVKSTHGDLPTQESDLEERSQAGSRKRTSPKEMEDGPEPADGMDSHGADSQHTESTADSEIALAGRGWLLALGCLALCWLLRSIWGWGGSYPEPVKVAPTFVVEINSASQPELEALPEIGPALARRIVKYRQDHGPFRNLESLLEVRGMGTATLNQIRPMLIVEISDNTPPPP